MSQTGHPTVRDCLATAWESNRLLSRHRLRPTSPAPPIPAHNQSAPPNTVRADDSDPAQLVALCWKRDSDLSLARASSNGSAGTPSPANSLKAKGR
jgi:hypothetical protein